MNDQPPNIFQLIPKVMADIGAVSKDRKNEQQGYKFRGIEDFYQSAHPALVKHGVFCCPQVVEHESQDRLTSNGKPAIRVSLKVSHKFYGPDGSCVDVVTCGEGIDTSDKATNKAMSAAMKYAFIELFSIPTQDIEDADRQDQDAGRKNGNGHPKVERTTEDIPLDGSILPPADDLITADQAKKLHMRFRESLRAELQPKADALLHDFLGQKLYLDSNGNPSANAILKTEFANVGKAAVAFAKEL